MGRIVMLAAFAVLVSSLLHLSTWAADLAKTRDATVSAQLDAPVTVLLAGR